MAITFAMLAHCFIHFDVWAQLGDGALFASIRTLTRSATPTFIILFGMMLEIVYLKLLRRGDRLSCWTKLLTRAIQCYLLYLCVAVAGILGGQLSLKEGLEAALFLDDAYFANILKFYSLGLLGGIVLLELRARFGFTALAAAFCVIWLSFPLVKALPPFPYALQDLASFLIGAGAKGGPSALQGMSLVIFGMLLGNTALKLLAAEPVKRRRGAHQAAWIAVAAAAATAALFLTLGPEAVEEGFVSFEFRGANHPGYYIIGASVALILIAFWSLLAARLPEPVLRRLNVFGTSSLFAYAFGNVALNLLPGYQGSLAVGLAASTAFLLCLYAATVCFQRAVQAPVAARGAPRGMVEIGRLHRAMQGATTALAGLFVRQVMPKPPAA
jgi:surface polysaccharide O-acyltransferase-like enzyme